MEEVEEARTGEPTPIRDVLVDLAADWRIKAAGAQGKEAVAMIRCAIELEAAAGHGQEGR